MPLGSGTRIGPYEIIDWLGAGGMGDVYRARDPRLARDVALKLISEALAGDPARLHRFEQEARAAGQLNHPNVLVVFDVGDHGGVPYIVSELLEGETLRARLRGTPWPWRKAVEYARQIADGLAAAHDRNIVHRDIKPENLFVTSHGALKILDFGIAKLTQPVQEAAPLIGASTDTLPGRVLGTAAYMSPEQVRGESVDARTDIFSLGAVLCEMLTGQPAFRRPTPAETAAAILTDEPNPAAAKAPAAVERIVLRCLEKSRAARFQSARDLAFALESVAATGSDDAIHAASAPRLSRAWLMLLAGLAAGAGLTALLVTAPSPAADVDDPLLDARFSYFTNWQGTEEGAEISPDGKLVAFLSDQDGEFDLWVSQVGTAIYHNLTRDLPPLAGSGSIVRKLGFTADSSEIWFNPGDGEALRLMPWAGGSSRPFLPQGANTPAWSADGAVAWVHKPDRDDPIFLMDPTGTDVQQIMARGTMKNLNPVWSPDGQWIYFARGAEPQDETEMDVWRLRPSGGAAERVTNQHLAINFLAPLDSRRLLYVARAEDRSGPWLWTLDVTSGRSRRVASGVDQYTSVSASRDGRRIVASVVAPDSELWTVPLLQRTAGESDVQPYRLPEPTGGAYAPRVSRDALFYLSARGPRDGLWTVREGKASEVRRTVDGAIAEPPAVSPDGSRLAVVVRREGTRHLSVMSSDGSSAQRLAASIEVDGAAGQSAVDWSPDGSRIVVGGRDDKGPALFVVEVASGRTKRLVEGTWVNPLWSPRDDLIVYAGRSVVGQVLLRGVRPDGTPAALPDIRVRPGGYRFLPDGSGLVFLPRIQGLDFWLADLGAGAIRPLTGLANRGSIRTFDITKDGKAIVFDRTRQNGNIVLIERPN
jgi:Tol biopolymer transport system component